MLIMCFMSCAMVYSVNNSVALQLQLGSLKVDHVKNQSKKTTTHNSFNDWLARGSGWSGPFPSKFLVKMTILQSLTGGTEHLVLTCLEDSYLGSAKREEFNHLNSLNWKLGSLLISMQDCLPNGQSACRCKGAHLAMNDCGSLIYRLFLRKKEEKIGQQQFLL